MNTVRINFHKTGVACYFSHLDLQRVMTRALKKSGLPVWYSLGYNPRIYLTFALPLTLGHESICESFDFRLNEELDEAFILNALKGTLPEGVELISVGKPTFEAAQICWAGYRITLFDELKKIEKAMREYMSTEVATVTKSTKKGSKDINLKEFVKLITITNPKDNELTFTAVFAAGTQMNLNPNLFLEYLSASYGIKTLDAFVRREHLFDENMDILQ